MRSPRSVQSCPTARLLFRAVQHVVPAFNVLPGPRPTDPFLSRHSVPWAMPTLRLTLVRANKLASHAKGSHADPYVKVCVGGETVEKSEKIKDDLNPVWNETFTLKAPLQGLLSAPSTSSAQLHICRIAQSKPAC